MDQPPRIEHDPLTTPQVAIGCGVSDETIRAYVKDGALLPLGKLPGARGAYYFDFETVAVFALERRLRAVGMLPPPYAGPRDYPRIGREKEQTLDDIAETG